MTYPFGSQPAAPPPAKNLSAIRRWATQAFGFYMSLDVGQRLYVNAAVLLVNALVSSLVLPRQVELSAWLLFSLNLIYVVCRDLLIIYKRIYDTVLGKAILLLLLTLCTNLSVSASLQVVNHIVLIDPSKFPHTVAFLTILSLPLFVAGGLGIIFFCGTVVSGLYLAFLMVPDDHIKEVMLPGYKFPRDRLYPKTTRLIQVLSIVIFCGMAWHFAQRATPGYERFVNNTARSFLFNWEMYPYAQCALKPGARVSFLADDKVFVGLKAGDSVSFEWQTCEAKIVPAPQPVSSGASAGVPTPK